MNQNRSIHYLSHALRFHLRFDIKKDSRVAPPDMKQIIYHPCFPQLIHLNIPHPFCLQSACNVLLGVRQNTEECILHLLENFMHFPPCGITLYAEFDCHIFILINGLLLPMKIMLVGMKNQSQYQPYNHNPNDHIQEDHLYMKGHQTCTSSREIFPPPSDFEIYLWLCHGLNT